MLRYAKHKINCTNDVFLKMPMTEHCDETTKSAAWRKWVRKWFPTLVRSLPHHSISASDISLFWGSFSSGQLSSLPLSPPPFLLLTASHRYSSFLTPGFNYFFTPRVGNCDISFISFSKFPLQRKSGLTYYIVFLRFII